MGSWLMGLWRRRSPRRPVTAEIAGSSPARPATGHCQSLYGGDVCYETRDLTKCRFCGAAYCGRHLAQHRRSIGVDS